MEKIYLIILSAIFGALTSHIVGNLFSKAKEIKDKRHHLLADLSSFSYEYMSSFLELYSTLHLSSNKQIDPHVQNSTAKLLSLRGKSISFEVRIWQFFKNRKSRASYQKLLNRFDKVHDLLASEKLPTPELFGKGLEWVQEQVAECSRHLANESGFNPKDPERFYFVALLSG